MKTKAIRSAAVRLAFGALLHGTAYAGPSTQLSQPAPSLSVSDAQSAAQPGARILFTKPSGSARRLGESAVSIKE
jgi:hypothetical protein